MSCAGDLLTFLVPLEKGNLHFPGFSLTDVRNFVQKRKRGVCQQQSEHRKPGDPSGKSVILFGFSFSSFVFVKKIFTMVRNFLEKEKRRLPPSGTKREFRRGLTHVSGTAGKGKSSFSWIFPDGRQELCAKKKKGRLSTVGT